MFSGLPQFGPLSISLVARHAVYDSPLTAQDTHIRHFWLSLYELSQEELSVLWRALSLFPSSKGEKDKERAKERIICDWSTDKYHYLSSSIYDPISLSEDERDSEIETERDCIGESIPIVRIMKPTATAMLLADSTEITLFPDLKALSLPKYLSLRVMQMQIRQLIKSLAMK
jgi:hypothetical protein